MKCEKCGWILERIISPCICPRCGAILPSKGTGEIKESKPPYAFIDKRGKRAPEPCCRVCGCEVCHSDQYNKPTMDCIKYLRSQISTFLDKGEEVKDE